MTSVQRILGTAILPILATCVLNMGACNNTPQGVASNAVIVGLADSGKLVRLEPEQQLVIKLNSNPTTGYQWRIDDTIDRSVLLPDATRFSQSSAEKARNEEVGTQYLRFVAQQPGRTNLSLVYTNPRSGDVPDTPRYKVEVIVAPKPAPGSVGRRLSHLGAKNAEPDEQHP